MMFQDDRAGFKYFLSWYDVTDACFIKQALQRMKNHMP